MPLCTFAPYLLLGCHFSHTFFFEFLVFSEKCCKALFCSCLCAFFWQNLENHANYCPKYAILEYVENQLTAFIPLLLIVKIAFIVFFPRVSAVFYYVYKVLYSCKIQDNGVLFLKYISYHCFFKVILHDIFGGKHVFISFIILSSFIHYLIFLEFIFIFLPVFAEILRLHFLLEFQKFAKNHFVYLYTYHYVKFLINFFLAFWPRISRRFF